MTLFHLVMFDVDGTLIKWNGIDRVCFSEAVKEVLGVDNIDTDWLHYLHVTDSGIASEIIERNLFRKAERRDILAIRQSYLVRLHHETERNPYSFRPVPRASELIADLRSMEGICLCIATGNWREAALLKLRLAGISTGDIPLASSDDSHERESIMLLAEERARVHKNCPAFSQVVYVADHVRDFLNARKLGYGFVGLGSGEHAQELKLAGVTHVQPDFTNKGYFLRVLGMPKH